MTRNLRVFGLAVVAILAMAAFASSAAQAVEFKFKTSEGNYPVSVAAAQEGTHVFEVETSASMTKSKVECPVAAFNGTAAGPNKIVKVHPEYKGEGEKKCLAFGQNATIVTTGCDYEVEAIAEEEAGKFNAQIDVVCEAGKVIQVNALTCRVTVGAQNNLGSATLINNPGPPKTVNLNAAVTGIAYTITEDGIGCPLRQTGGTGLPPLALADATYAGKTLVKAFIGVTQQNATVE